MYISEPYPNGGLQPFFWHPVVVRREPALMLNHISSGIFISGIAALQQQEEVRRAGIRAVLRLDGQERQAGQWGPDFALLDMPISDARPVPRERLQAATAFINQQVQAQQQVLVHCQMGISRASTMVMAYMIEYLGMALPKAYSLVQRQHPIAQPHPALLGSLVEAYGLPYYFTDVYSADFLKRLLREYSS